MGHPTPRQGLRSWTQSRQTCAASGRCSVQAAHRQWTASGRRVELGPVVSASAREGIVAAITHGIEEGAEAVLDGRTVQVPEYPRGYFVGPTILDQIQPEMRVYKEEIFGPVIGMSPVSSLDRVGV